MHEGVRRRRPFALYQPTDLPPEPPGPHRVRAGSERPQLLVVKESTRLYPPALGFWTRDRRRLRDRRLSRARGNASHNEPVGHAPRPTLLSPLRLLPLWRWSEALHRSLLRQDGGDAPAHDDRPEVPAPAGAGPAGRAATVPHAAAQDRYESGARQTLASRRAGWACNASLVGFGRGEAGAQEHVASDEDRYRSNEGEGAVEEPGGTERRTLHHESEGERSGGGPAGGAGLGDAGCRSGRSRVSSDDGEVKETRPTPSGGEGEYYPEHQQGNGTAREQYEPHSSDPEHPGDEAQAPAVHFVGEVAGYNADGDAGGAPQGQEQTGHAHFYTCGNRRLDGEGAQRVGRRRSKPDTQSQQDKRREGYVAGSRLLDVTEASLSASGHEQDDAEGKGGAAGEGPTPANGRGDGGNGKAGEQGSRWYGRLLDAEGQSLTPLPNLSGEKEVRRGWEIELPRPPITRQATSPHHEPASAETASNETALTAAARRIPRKDPTRSTRRPEATEASADTAKNTATASPRAPSPKPNSARIWTASPPVRKAGTTPAVATATARSTDRELEFLLVTGLSGLKREASRRS